MSSSTTTLFKSSLFSLNTKTKPYSLPKSKPTNFIIKSQSQSQTEPLTHNNNSNNSTSSLATPPSSSSKHHRPADENTCDEAHRVNVSQHLFSVKYAPFNTNPSST
ncbi:unnamed protein product [Lathyrus sativus]|nr:unnamed protein product [Lathyrus sativus]